MTISVKTQPESLGPISLDLQSCIKKLLHDVIILMYNQVGSLRVIQFGALVLMVVGALGKFGALFVCIPDPIVGGVFMVMFGMITAVGISNLQFADMNSSRNLFIVGFSTVFGLGLPYYMKNYENAISTGDLLSEY